MLQTEHNSKVEFLDTFARLIGCHEIIQGGFPDGKRPDVLRCNLHSGTLFIGDAKHTETPGNLRTQERLTQYLEWLQTFSLRKRGLGIFALCFTRLQDTNLWIDTISNMSASLNLQFVRQGIEIFDRDTVVTWFITE